ncbi:MAG: hypothetical protein ACPLRZ_11595 [Thermovenabulum sp.]|uniref:hypothetical protein n=1 Tax=Thermovenabulum sp. TaxID=3100335 RepID=UPI003C7B9D3C
MMGIALRDKNKEEVYNLYKGTIMLMDKSSIETSTMEIPCSICGGSHQLKTIAEASHSIRNNKKVQYRIEKCINKALEKIEFSIFTLTPNIDIKTIYQIIINLYDNSIIDQYYATIRHIIDEYNYEGENIDKFYIIKDENIIKVYNNSVETINYRNIKNTITEATSLSLLLLDPEKYLDEIIPLIEDNIKRYIEIFKDMIKTINESIKHIEIKKAENTPGIDYSTSINSYLDKIQQKKISSYSIPSYEVIVNNRELNKHNVKKYVTTNLLIQGNKVTTNKLDKLIRSAIEELAIYFYSHQQK